MVNGTFFLHTRPTRGLEGTHYESRATVACKVVGQEIWYGVSICMAGDNFSRAEGRQRAYERMNFGYGKISRSTGIFATIDDDEQALTLFAQQLAAAIKHNPRKYEDRVSKFKKVNGLKSGIKKVKV
jgi:hypothetical protein